MAKYRKGLNRFSDGQESIARKPVNVEKRARSIVNIVDLSTFKDPPRSVDWREKGFVGKVRDQKDCDCDYAIVASATLASHSAIKHDQFVELSVSQLVDCTQGKPYFQAGCTAGTETVSWQYILDNKGVDTDESYPFKPVDTSKCASKAGAIGAQVASWRSVDSYNETALEIAVANLGPVVAVIGTPDSLKAYHAGIYDDKDCSLSFFKAFVTVVGYGRDEKDAKFWILQMGWGESWGEKGYVRIARQAGNVCHVAYVNDFPIAA